MPEAGLTQADRPILIASPLGDDKLFVRSFSGREGLSEMFDFNIDVISEKKTIEASEIIGSGKHVTLAIRMPDSKIGTPQFRHWNGVVTDFVQTSDLEQRYPAYRLRVRPWFWLLTRTADCRMFQDKSVLEIAKAVFGEYGFQDFKDNTTRDYAKREYCVQYRETAANFLMRLFDEEGIYFYFEHEERKHTLVMADNTVAAKDLPVQAKYRWEPVGGNALGGQEDTVGGWERRYQVLPMRWMQQDYNFETPNLDLNGQKDTVIELPMNKYEIFDYPGLFKDKGNGDKLTLMRMQETEAAHETVIGQGSGRSMMPGFKFKFVDHPNKQFEGDYVITTVLHEGGQSGYRSDPGNSTDHYSNSFSCIPRTVNYRHPRVTPKPVVHGTQTAFVVGPSGEEIYVDKYGRVKVLFHWDRYGKANENSSCWMRVSQSIAGIKWGSIYIPRIGHEVVVDFLEGDPDRPIIVGSVYNANTMPPYTLPDEKTKTTFKSNSSKGGGGFNEFRFEDLKGKEQVYLQAHKQLDVRVNADYLEFTGADKHEIVKKNRFEKVWEKKHQEVVGDQNEKIGGGKSLNVGGNHNEKIGQKWAAEAGTEIHFKAGMKAVIEAGTQITLKVGGNFVDIGPAGVTIKGTMVLINSGGAAGSGSGASPTAPTAPKEADNAQPGSVSQAPPKKAQPGPPPHWSPCALTLKNAAQTGAPFCEICNS